MRVILLRCSSHFVQLATWVSPLSPVSRRTCNVRNVPAARGINGLCATLSGSALTNMLLMQKFMLSQPVTQCAGIVPNYRSSDLMMPGVRKCPAVTRIPIINLPAFVFFASKREIQSWADLAGVHVRHTHTHTRARARALTHTHTYTVTKVERHAASLTD